MSSTFDIYPSEFSNIMTESVLKLTSERLSKLLHEFKKSTDMTFTSDLCEIESESIEIEQYVKEITFNEEHYLTIKIEPIDGIICAYFWDLDKHGVSYWKERLTDNDIGQLDVAKINECITKNKQWQLRREGAQHPFVDIIMGVMASSLATLSNGFVHCTDYGWDPEIFPCTGEQLYKSYFEPNSINDQSIKEGYIEAIQSIA